MTYGTVDGTVSEDSGQDSFITEVTVNGYDGPRTVRLEPPVRFPAGGKVEEADPRLLAAFDDLLRFRADSAA